MGCVWLGFNSPIPDTTMKISKHIHSCLLVEDQGKVVLIDPGTYSVASDAITLDMISQLDYLLITHEHQDHFDLAFVKQLVEKFPDLKIITTPSIVEQLAKEGITATDKGDEHVTVTPVPHEKIWMGPVPQNILFTLFGRLAHPGDSHTFITNAEILALPVTAPWGSTTKAVEIAEALKPTTIIPIHDWHWRDEARQQIYQWIKGYLQPKGIDFKTVESGETIEV